MLEGMQESILCVVAGLGCPIQKSKSKKRKHSTLRSDADVCGKGSWSAVLMHRSGESAGGRIGSTTSEQCERLKLESNRLKPRLAEIYTATKEIKITHRDTHTNCLCYSVPALSPSLARSI